MPNDNMNDLEDALDSPADIEETPDGSSDEGKSNEESIGDGDGAEESEGSGEGEEPESEPEGKDKSKKEEPSDDDDSGLLEDEELTSASPVNLEKLHKQYPKLFKEYPALRETIVREQKFTEILGSLDEAKEAYDRSESFKNFQAELSSGQSVNLLGYINKLNPRAFDKFTTNFLDAVAKVSPQQRDKILWTPITRFIKHVYTQGNVHGNKDLMLSARHITNFLTNGEENLPDRLEEPKAEKEDVESEERTRLNQERNRFLKERYDIAYDSIVTQIDGSLTKEIESTLDPNNRFSKLERDALVNNIINEVNQVLGKSDRHSNTMRIMWDRAKNASYTHEWMNRIRDQILSSAKRILPGVVQKHRAEALKGKKAGAAPNNNVAPGRAAGPKGNGAVNTSGGKKRIDYSKTSDKDIFEGNIKYVK